MLHNHNFFIDAILLATDRLNGQYKSPNRLEKRDISNGEKDRFILRLIPDVDSEFYPPHLMRYIIVEPSLLEKPFYSYVMQQNELAMHDMQFLSSVKQGGYYSTPDIDFFSDLADIELVNDENNFFDNRLLESPYIENYSNIITDTKTSPHIVFSQADKTNRAFLYSFNVGQGDSFLLITSANTAYLIDTNIYNTKGYRNSFSFIHTVKNVLCAHNIDVIKALIITHKHIDHLRGAKYFILNSGIPIENFIINLDYLHQTRCVYELSKAVSKKIGSTINANSPFEITDGNTKISFVNPTSKTSTNAVAPDINDSSLVMKVLLGNTSLYLTGDAHYNILQDCFTQVLNPSEQTFLKVSHHGSNTGTSKSLLNSVNPYRSFISAGTNKKYNHPHLSTRILLADAGTCFIVSKDLQCDMCYIMDGSNITQSTL